MPRRRCALSPYWALVPGATGFRSGAVSSGRAQARGTHLLLTGFTKRLDAYASFAMTLVFEKAGSVVIEVMVEEAEQPKAQ